VTRYELVIDLGEHESAMEAASGVMLPTHASWHVRPSLPVLPTCGDCHHHGAGLGRKHSSWRCYHESRVDPVIVDLDAAPPQDCPLRSKGAP
jgi:hypothetical protein